MGNIYNTPIEGEPDYRQQGIIKAIDESTGVRHPIGRLTYEHFWNEEYQYIFELDWDAIDRLPKGVFCGIAGLDWDLRLPKYYRVNMTPSFMKQRTPDKNREDLWEMMASVGLDYYDRFEYLLRTPMKCGNDNIVVDKE